MSLTGHEFIVGATGAGKTVTAKGRVEALLSDARHVCVIDPTGVWYGLRTLADGETRGFDIPIFGGLRGDVPVSPQQGSAVGAIIASGVSAVLDLSQMDSDEQQGFVSDLVAALRKKPRGNFHLVVDEADEFAPQTSPSGAAEAAKRQLEWVAKRGRVQGFVLMAITQRPADIAKSVISQMQTVIMHQLIAPADRNAVKAYLKDNADKETLNTVMSSLSGLETGERWIYSPRAEILDRGVSPLPCTFDTSRTPEPGEDPVEPKMLAELDLGEIRAALAPPKSDEEGSGNECRNMSQDMSSDQIGDLVRSHAAFKAAIADRDLYRKRCSDLVDSMMDFENLVSQAIDTLKAVLPSERKPGEFPSEFDDCFQIPAQGGGGSAREQDQLGIEQRGSGPCAAAPDKKIPAKPQRESSDGARQEVTDGETSLTNGARKMVKAVAKNHPRMLPIQHVAALAGVSMASSQWRNNRSSFENCELIDTVGDQHSLSPLGIERFRVQGQPDDPEARVAFWRNAFPPSTSRILQVLVDAGGSMLTKEEIADAAAISRTSSGLDSGLRTLRNHGLVRDVDGGFAASKVLI